ncbi:MAG TPA: ACP synthase [Vicinamibacteria bacterium]|nr:ACP synthase [Vicinamibacteria bacterium]
MGEHGVVASAIELLEIADALALTQAPPAESPFSDEERAYAFARSDPDRRLAARLAAKRAALRLLGGELGLRDVEVVRGRGGPPRLRLSARARERMAALGAGATLVSLTHERRHAAASVLLLRGAG